jgi:hypothetical protein
MEGLRIFDEVNRIQLPPMLSHVAVASPLTAKLRDLTPEQLDVLQVAMQLQVAMPHTQLETVFNNCTLDDIKVANALSVLIEGGYIKVTPPTGA